MEILFPILTLPLAIGFGLILNIYGDYFHRASEQVRLDAYTLSICHQRAHFIQDEITPSNRKILKLQEAMDFAAEACDKAMEVPVAGQAICAASLTTIETLAAVGQALEIEQNVMRETYAAKSIAARNDLSQKKSAEQKIW